MGCTLILCFLFYDLCSGCAFKVLVQRDAGRFFHKLLIDVTCNDEMLNCERRVKVGEEYSIGNDSDCASLKCVNIGI